MVTPQFYVYLTLTTGFHGSVLHKTERHVAPLGAHYQHAQAFIMAAEIRYRDPFNATPDQRERESCGPNRPLGTVRTVFDLMVSRDSVDDYAIADEVVMEYYESRDDVLWWTPLCLTTPLDPDAHQ